MNEYILDLILYSTALCGVLMVIILIACQYLIIARKSKYYQMIVDKEKERDKSIEILIKNQHKILQRIDGTNNITEGK